MEIVSKKAEDTEKLAKKIAQFLKPQDIILLDGDLGAGKTTFTKGLALGLGIKKNVKSPTFTIVREYHEGRLPLYHMDVYRLEEADESIGFNDYFNKGGVTIIEWADIIKDSLPQERLVIKFKVIDEDTRVLVFIPYGEKYEELCSAVL